MKTWKTNSNYIITQVLSGRSNVFLLSNGSTNILIDTGIGWMWKILDSRLKSMQIRHIDYLILTHTHNDHAANAYKIKTKYNPSIIVHRDESAHLLKGETIIPQGTYKLSRLFINLFEKKIIPFCQYTPCTYDKEVGYRLELSEIGFNAYILHTPGHSAGSISIIIEEEIALVGDNMLGRGEYYTYPPFADDPVELMNSWNKLLNTGCRLFIPSHGYANNRALVEKVYNKWSRRISKNSIPAP